MTWLKFKHGYFKKQYNATTTLPPSPTIMYFHPHINDARKTHVSIVHLQLQYHFVLCEVFINFYCCRGLPQFISLQKHAICFHDHFACVNSQDQNIPSLCMDLSPQNQNICMQYAYLIPQDQIRPLVMHVFEPPKSKYMCIMHI